MSLGSGRNGVQHVQTVSARRSRRLLNGGSEEEKNTAKIAFANLDCIRCSVVVLVENNATNFQCHVDCVFHLFCFSDEFGEAAAGGCGGGEDVDVPVEEVALLLSVLLPALALGFEKIRRIISICFSSSWICCGVRWNVLQRKQDKKKTLCK